VRRRKGSSSLLFIVALTLVAFGATLLAGNTPFLGLDLQGGVSVTLQPIEDTTDEALDDAIAIIRSRIDTTGVAEPEITRQGQTIVVEIPGVEDPDEAIELVGQTGELRFRPVLEVLGPSVPVEPPVEGDPAEEPTTDDTAGPPGGDGEQGLGLGLGESAGAAQETAPVAEEPAAEEPGDEPSADEPPTSDLSIPVGPDGQPDLSQLPPELQAQLGGLGGGGAPVETTPPEEDDPNAEVVLPQIEVVDGQEIEVGRYRLGPVYRDGERLLTGNALEGATAQIDQVGQWVVNPAFRAGPDGIDLFNGAVAQCFAQDPACPTGLLAITMDSRVISAPQINDPAYSRDQIQISGSFDQSSAKELATVLRYGALPVQLEQQQAVVVSASLGRDALDAGLVAGAIGLALVAVYMVAFYRLLGLAAMAKLAVEGALLWAIVAYLGESQGLALTLAGVTGIIVSIGISVDSNVVYYEHLKEDVRRGRSLRSAGERSFGAVWSTIVKADLASLLAAAILYFLAVGPVRGFAFYLGLATLLDLFAGWFFMRPLVAMLLRSDMARDHPERFGMPSGPRGEPQATGPVVSGGLDAAGTGGGG
jgi:preprotein translocase subunit SecD